MNAMKRKLPARPDPFAASWQNWVVQAAIYVVFAIVFHQGRFAALISSVWTIFAVLAIGIATYKYFHDPRD
jgi:hypothetical protein